jgi:hypothetical protein
MNSKFKRKTVMSITDQRKVALVEMANRGVGREEVKRILGVDDRRLGELIRGLSPVTSQVVLRLLAPTEFKEKKK